MTRWSFLDAKFYRTSKIGKNMIPSSISSSFRVQINRKLNSHQFCPLNFLNPTYGSKVIKFQKDGKGCIRIQMLYTFKKVCSIIQRCCKEFLSCLTIIFLKFYFTPALKYIITNISRSQWFFLDVLTLNLVPFLIRFVVRLKLKLNTPPSPPQSPPKAFWMVTS